MRSDVTLLPLDRPLLTALLAVAVADADPPEVMPPVPDPTGGDGWTAERRAAFVRFHAWRSLPPDPVESTYAITVAGRVAGAARLCPRPDRNSNREREGPGTVEADTVEAGLWIGRSYRGAGVGGTVLRLLIDRARADGHDRLYLSTTPENTAMRQLMSGIGLIGTQGEFAL
ncbi:N-acetyltransferase family protein [Streptomyces xiamenensis]|uniref:N-acetyltransferase gcn5 n=1 Tax=Streptomyces xiamenensis TaxID=408015 RepID=A0A0F7FWF7_9ACTN|nr:GNAT family N-acetyltransferase [Streptomyces xiamenensis]AKG44322.1 n-acetyltransferase gcn5 [Streptomyces xiamenensis]